MTEDRLVAAECVLQPLAKLAEQKSERCARILFQDLFQFRAEMIALDVVCISQRDITRD